MPGQRIISLLPAATEIVCALGLRDNLVGRSHECDYPESVKTLPVCTEANIEAGLSSGEIDTCIKNILGDALPVYTLKRDVIRQLAPDMVITQAQCDVCAVSLPQVEQALEDDTGRVTRILSLSPATLTGIFDNISEVAAALGVQESGASLLEQLHERLDIIRHKLKFISDRPLVACVEWLDPFMISGNWIPGLVQIAGGLPILAESGKHSRGVQWTDIQAADPDIIILMPCGFGIAQTMKELNLLLQQPGFAELKAIKGNRLYITDGNRYFNRPGPAIVDSVEILAEIINPKQFIFGYEGAGWIRFEAS